MQLWGLFFCVFTLKNLWILVFSQGFGLLPPTDFFVDVTMKYLNIPDVVISTHEKSSVQVEEYVISLNKQNIFSSVFVWNNYELYEEQFNNFIRVVSSGKQLTIVFFMDDKSSRMFFKYAHKVKEVLPLPCYYRWIFFNVNGLNMQRLQRLNTSAVCWKTIYITTPLENRKNESLKWSLFGPSVAPYGNCLIKKHLGDWYSEKAFKKLHQPDRKINDFQGKTLTTAVQNGQPFYSHTEEGYEGIEYELLTFLRTKLNFRILMMNNSDGEIGRQLSNGTWTGCVGLVHEGKAIFSAATLSISSRRMKAVDFSSPYLFGKLGFVVINPALLGRKMVLIKPLTPSVWIMLLVTLCACTSVLYLITHTLPCKRGVRNAYNIWFLLRTIGQQGTPSPAPNRYSIRFFISFWWIYILVILWSYSGILTTFMLYPGRRPAVDTVDKLRQALKFRNIRYGTTIGTSYEHFFKTYVVDGDPVFRDNIEKSTGFQPRCMNEGMNLVLRENYAYVNMAMLLEWHMARMGSSKFLISKDYFKIDAVGVAIQKCHPCKKSFDHIINRLEETGFIYKWYQDEFTKATIKGPLTSVNEIRPLSMDDLQGAFYLGGIGLGIALVALILEIFVAKIINMRKSKRKKRKHKKNKKHYKNSTFTYWITGFEFENLKHNKTN